MKKSILIFALSRSPWIGGIYYRKNIIHMLLTNSNIKNKYNIAVLTNDKYKNVFEAFRDEIDIIACNDGAGIAAAVFHSIMCCIKHRVKYVFPLRPFGFLKLFGITPISWIADFQHCHYPAFFEKKEIEVRNANFRQIAKANTPLVLSSNDALKDFRTFFSRDRGNVFVVHFTSYIEDELLKLESFNQEDILKSYGLTTGNYAVICNQFWKHKNHIVVLEAIRILKKKMPRIKLQFVFTGELSDRRNPEYMEEVNLLLNDAAVRDSVKVLGFIDRMSQLCIMKNAAFLIQPSLFEGWSTVVEDAKVLNMRMILSDIAVHIEQKNENSILFQKNDPEDLAESINKLLAADCDGFPAENADMSEQYARVFENIFV